MKSKAHYKKCVELGVVPVPTTVCDENIDKEAIARLAATGGGNVEESSEEEEESEGEESEESGNEEQEAAQSLLSLSQRNTTNTIPGLLPSGRPTTYPYASSTLSTTTIASVVSTVASTSVVSSQNVTAQGTAPVQNEVPQRYYFPSTRNSTEEPRISVIQSSKKDDADFEVEEVIDASSESPHQLSQPIDLTLKQTTQLLPSPIPQRARPADILTPVSEPVLLQTIVQTMERLPIQGREWKPDAEGHMLQAYLTERHVMDSKIKQQYRVGNTKMDNKQVQERETYPRHQDLGRSRHVDCNGVPTVTYTDPSKMQHTIMESRIKHMTKHTSDDIKMEIREKIYQNNMAMERRAFDYENIHKDKEQSNHLVSNRENFEQHNLTNDLAGIRSNIEYNLPVTKNNSSVERSVYSGDASHRNTPVIERHSPKSLNMDVNRPPLMHVNNDIDRNPMFAMKMMSEIERPRECHPVTQEMRSANHELRAVNSDMRIQNHSPRNLDLRPPSREIRTPGQEYKTPNQDLRLPSQQEYKMEYKMRGQEMRPPSREYLAAYNAHDMQVIQELMPSTNMEMRQTNSDNRPPSSDIRVLSEYRTQSSDHRANYEVIQPSMHESGKPQNVDARNTQEIRIVYYDTKHNAEKQNIPDSIKHTVARKIVVGPDFRSPSPNMGNPKPQAEFLQPSSGPPPNYVR